MNSMMPKTTYPYVMTIVSAAALLSGCVTGDQAPPRIAQNDPLTVRSAFQEKAATSDDVVTGAHYFPYERDALYQLRAAVGSPSTIELQPGETLINYALGDGSFWIVDDVDGTEQTLLQVEPTQPDLSTPSADQHRQAKLPGRGNQPRERPSRGNTGLDLSS